MKIKFQHATGKAVITYKNDNGTLGEAVDLLKNPDVISLSIVKETPAQYFKRVGPLNSPPPSQNP